MRALAFFLPGRVETLTGGYEYDRQVIAGLRTRGWRVSVTELDASFPFPTPAALADAAVRLAAEADDALVLVDGLAMGAMPEVIEREHRRLAIVALVHHPLGAETGLDSARSAWLFASERRSLACARLVVVTSHATADTVAAMEIGRAHV